MDVSRLLLEGVVWYGVFVFSTILHEAAHAWAALKLGDATAYLGGQVSLDPVPHMRREPMGMIGVPLLTFFLAGGQWMMGWASAPYNLFWALEHPRRAAWMALAGPLANLLLVLVSGGVLKLGLAMDFFGAPQELSLTHLVGAAPDSGLDAVAFFFSLMFSLNLVLLIFNLMPVPPLDGSGLPPLFLKPYQARDYLRTIRNPGFAMAGLLVAWFGFRYLIRPVFDFVITKFLYPDLFFF